MSILCVDLVGFVARSDQADPEDIRTTLRPYHACVRRELAAWGGTVEKFIGDAVIAAFGAPVAQEDDAERAVRAGLRVVQAVQELNAAEPALELALRVAVTTGEAVVARGTTTMVEGAGLATGDVVNTAAYLQAIAPVGAVVVDDVTYRTTRHLVDYEALDPVSVNEQGEPIRVWQARAARGRYGADTAEATPSPFIGRDHELALLKTLYARAARESSAQLVTVAGEPGVGKSRLVREFRAFVDSQPERARWRQGRCLPYGEGITFWALGEIVKTQAGILESDGPHEASDKLAAAIGAMIEDPTERDWLKTRLALLVGASAPGVGGPAERSESFAAWRRFLEAVAGDRPLVLVFEDVHWAGAALLEFVEYLVDWATGLPFLIVSTTRPELFEHHPGWGGGKRDTTTISLAPLSREETSRLIAAHLPGVELPGETQVALLERAGGNPLYAGEFARMLADRGIVERRGQTMQVAAGVDIPIPETVQAVIAARLDTLPAERKALLHDAAVMGPVFWVGALAYMSGLDERAVERGLRTVARKELLRPVRISSVKGEAEYSFRHLLIRDVAYQQIPRAARVRKHRRAATWIERLAGDRVTDHADILAHHYGQALKLAKAAGLDEDTPELEIQVRRFLIMAGDRALELDAWKAEAFYRQALELSPRVIPAGQRCSGRPPRPPSSAAGSPRPSVTSRRRSSSSARRGRSSGRVSRWCAWPEPTGSEARPTENGRFSPRRSNCSSASRPDASWPWPIPIARPTTWSPTVLLIAPCGRRRPWPWPRSSGSMPKPSEPVSCGALRAASSATWSEASPTFGRRFDSASISAWGTRRSGPMETSAIGCGSPRGRLAVWT